MTIMIRADMKKVSSAIPTLIAIDRKDSKPLYRQVYDGYRTAIVNGRLRAGQRVPSTRILASDLGVSRIPILNAYAQLTAEGYFLGQVGVGTVISRSLPDQIAVSGARGSGPAKAPRSRLLPKRTSLLDAAEDVPWRRGWGAFCVSQVAFEDFPFPVWNSLVTRHCRSACAKSFDYGNPMGSKDLREAVATYLRTARGVRCEAEQIMIVSGSQQALAISARALLDRGNRVWLEEPGYRFARNTFVFSGFHIVPVPVDDEGLNVAAGIRQCRKAKAALVTPSHQYPLGVTLSASRRLQLLDWAESSGSWIIEDDYDSEYRYESMPIASLQGLDGNARVIYIGTFSKVLFPSLRLGYLVIPPDLVKHFLAVRVAMDMGPANFHQAVLADFIREGHFSRHIRRMRLLYSERRSRLVENIRKDFGLGAEVTGEQAGMHLCVAFNGIRDHEIAQRAARHSLWLVPLSSSYMSKACRQGFILGFGSTVVEEIPRAIRTLRAVMGVQ